MRVQRSAEAMGGAPLSHGQTVLVALFAAVFLGLFLLAMAARGAEPLVYLRDPAATFGFSPVAGFISTLGVAALVGAGAICLFASRHGGPDRTLLGAVGAFSLVIAADDFFMFHEEVGPNILGVPEVAVLLAHGAVAGVIFGLFSRALLGQRHVGLHASLVFLGLSVAVDLLAPYGPTAVILEDGSKFVGLILWTAYWVRRADGSVRQAGRATGARATQQRGAIAAEGRLPTGVAQKPD